MYGIIKDGKTLQTFDNWLIAAQYLASLNDSSLSLSKVPATKEVAVVPAAVPAALAEIKVAGKADLTVRNAGKPKKYMASTLEKIAAIVKRGIDKPKYGIYAQASDGVVMLVAYTSTEKGAKYIVRKARGFTRRVLVRKYAFKIVKLDKTVLQAIS